MLGTCQADAQILDPRINKRFEGFKSCNGSYCSDADGESVANPN
jgi:hypothetical protein